MLDDVDSGKMTREEARGKFMHFSRVILDIAAEEKKRIGGNWHHTYYTVGSSSADGVYIVEHVYFPDCSYVKTWSSGQVDKNRDSSEGHF